MIYNYLVGCSPIPDLFGNGKPILGFPLQNKADISQAIDQTTALLFLP